MKLSFTCFYSGIGVSYWAGVLPSSISFTQHLGPQRKSMMGLASVMVSIGSLVGGVLLICFKDFVDKKGRNTVIMIGLISHLTGYVMSFLFLSHLSPMGETNQVLFTNFAHYEYHSSLRTSIICEQYLQPPYLSPSMVVILAIAFLMGLGEAAFNTQIISLISSQFTGNTSQAFALYKLVQSLGISVGFAVSTRVGLYWQLLGIHIK